MMDQSQGSSINWFWSWTQTIKFGCRGLHLSIKCGSGILNWTWSTTNLVGHRPKELVNPLIQQGDFYDGTTCSNKKHHCAWWCFPSMHPLQTPSGRNTIFRRFFGITTTIFNFGHFIPMTMVHHQKILICLEIICVETL